MPKNNSILLKAGQPIIRSGDTEYPFRVNSDFFWTTGIEEPGAITLITSSGSETLFLPKTSEFERLWRGSRLDSVKASAQSGIKNVVSLNQLPKFKKLLQIPPMEPRSAHKLICSLRMVKDPLEIEIMKKAAEITAQSFKVALSKLKPKLMEYELEAVITQGFYGLGANGHAYTPIVASGVHACTLHYVNNDHQLKSSQLVLVDAGAEYANYSADVTRTWPAGGQFSDRQKAVYQAVLKVQKAAIARLKPGMTLKDSETATAKDIVVELIHLGLLELSALSAFGKVKNHPYKKYFPHATSHFLGLDTHDVGDYQRPLEPGMVITVEPGIYIREEEIGVRLEDDILITEVGSENLTQNIPIEIKAIESLMARVGR